MGRPSKVRPWLTADGLADIEKWAEQGLSETKIAEMMGVDQSTFIRWKRDYTSIPSAIKKGVEAHLAKQRAEVESTLKNLAVKHWLEEEEVYEEKDGFGNVIKSTKRKRRREVDGNPTVNIFLAKSLMPEKYGERVDKVDDSKVEQWENEVANAILALAEDK